MTTPNQLFASHVTSVAFSLSLSKTMVCCLVEIAENRDARSPQYRVMKAMGLRSMSAPGTAYNDPLVGKDPQPAHMRDFVDLPNTDEGDWGGVHYNSGIPNKAFYLVAKALGQPAWTVAGKIWYVTLTERLRDNADFKKCAYETISVAGDYFGAKARKAVRAAWTQVGVIQAGEGPVG